MAHRSLLSRTEALAGGKKPGALIAKQFVQVRGPFFRFAAQARMAAQLGTQWACSLELI